MTHELKTEYLRLAISLQGIPINKRIADQIVTTYETILEKGGNFSLSDAVDIEAGIVLKYEMKSKETEVTTKPNE